MSWEISLISLDGDPLAPQGRSYQQGLNTYVKELSQYLGGYGLKIDVYSRRNNNKQPSLEDYSRGARVIRIPVGPPEDIQQDQWIRYLKDIANWIPTHQIQQGLHYRLVHSHTYLSGPVGIHLKEIWGIPLVHTFHSLGLVEEELLGPGNPNLETRKKIEKLICSKADKIIATSNQGKMDLVELYQVDPGSITVIPSCVNLEIFHPLPQSESRQEIAFPDDIFLITYVGSLEEWHGLDTLLRAIHLIDNPAIQAVIVGGPLSEKPFLSRAELSQDPFQKYVAKIDEYGLDRQITFTGSKPQKQLAKYFSAGDVTVIPSIFEPFNTTANEALACGSSVIASRIGSLTSTVKENHVGVLFEPGNPEQLAEKIKLFYDQPKINEELRKNARPYAEDNFNWESGAKSITNLYQSLIE